MSPKMLAKSRLVGKRTSWPHFMSSGGIPRAFFPWSGKIPKWHVLHVLGTYLGTKGNKLPLMLCLLTPTANHHHGTQKRQLGGTWPGPPEGPPGPSLARVKPGLGQIFWKYGTWKSGNLETKQIPPKKSQNQNPICPKCRQSLD